VTKKIWVRVSSENQGYIESCLQCGVMQPDSASAFRQLHEEDCPIAPGPTDLLERIEEINKPRSEDPDVEIEYERVRKAQELKAIREQAIESANRDEFERKVQEGKVIATAQSSDPDWKIKEQIGFIESAIKGQNLQFLHLQIDWATQFLAGIEELVDIGLREKLIERIEQASKLANELSTEETK
jgi:hypothetical protein